MEEDDFYKLLYQLYFTMEEDDFYKLLHQLYFDSLYFFVAANAER